MDIDSLARAAYHAYGVTVDFKNYQGLPMPEWVDLGDQIRDAWRAAARDLYSSGYRDGAGQERPNDWD